MPLWEKHRTQSVVAYFSRKIVHILKTKQNSVIRHPQASHVVNFRLSEQPVEAGLRRFSELYDRLENVDIL